jgi:hypothetical protein
MITTSPPIGNGSSAAARWMSGLGAFLLVAAAATFTAVRWEEIPDEAKFAGLVALTVACLAADRRLRSRLPIAASAVFHMGILLVPIDLAAVGVWLGWEWPTMVLAQGVAVTATCGAAAATRQSVVLRCATWLGVVLLASGMGALSGAPASLLLASAALIGAATAVAASEMALGRAAERAAAGWATLAGFSLPLAGAENLGLPGAGVLAELGLATPAPHPTAAVTGLVAATALFIVAHRWQNVVVALAGVASLLTGAVTTWTGLEPSLEASLVAGSVLLLLAEVVAGLLREDPFWATPSAMVARSGEVVAGVATVSLAGVVVFAPLVSETRPVLALAASLVAVTWLACLARTRRPDARQYWPWTLTSAGLNGGVPFASAVAAGAAAVLASDMPEARSVVLAAAGLLVVLVTPTALPGATVNRTLGLGLLAWAPVVAYERPALSVGLGIIGASLAAMAAVDTARYSGTRAFTSLIYTQATLSVAPLAAGWLVAVTQKEAALGTLGAIAGAWLVAVVLDRVEITPAPRTPMDEFRRAYGYQQPRLLPPAMIPRLAALVPLAMVVLVNEALFSAADALLVAGLMVGLSGLDAARLDEPRLLLGAGCAAPVAIASAVFLTDGTVEQASMALCLSGLVWLGVAAAVPERWVNMTALAGAAAGVSGLLLGLEDRGTTSVNLLLAGVALLMIGAVRDDVRWTAAGWGTTTLGLWGQLALNEVSWTEPYVAPAAGILWALGYHARRRGVAQVSSWLAYAPAVAVLGGAALVERLVDGSSGWHGVLAGAVGVAAVAVGGLWRQAGSLVSGTILVLAVTAHETLDATAQVPTWAWLAAGGATLLGLGIFLERRGTGPLETGRRLVDLVGERFT